MIVWQNCRSPHGSTFPMANTNSPHSPETLSEGDVRRLIEQVEQNALSADDQRLIVKVLQSYIFVANMLRETGTKLKTVRDFFWAGCEKQKRP